MEISVGVQSRSAGAVLGALALENIECEDGECAALLLDPTGYVQDANRSAEYLFGYSREELVDWHVSLLLPKLAEVQNQDVFRRLAYLSHCGVAFRANRNHGRGFACAVFFTYLNDAGRQVIRLTIREIDSTNLPCL